MSTTPSERRRAKRSAAKAEALVVPAVPAEPPPSVEEMAARAALDEQFQETIRRLHQRNLDNAVMLAQQAAAGRGPLVDHFHELGRRFGHTLNAPPPRPRLRVISGDVA